MAKMTIAHLIQIIKDSKIPSESKSLAIHYLEKLQKEQRQEEKDLSEAPTKKAREKTFQEKFLVHFQISGLILFVITAVLLIGYSNTSTSTDSLNKQLVIWGAVLSGIYMLIPLISLLIYKSKAPLQDDILDLARSVYSIFWAVVLVNIILIGFSAFIGYELYSTKQFKLSCEIKTDIYLANGAELTYLGLIKGGSGADHLIVRLPIFDPLNIIAIRQSDGKMIVNTTLSVKELDSLTEVRLIPIEMISRSATILDQKTRKEIVDCLVEIKTLGIAVQSDNQGQISFTAKEQLLKEEKYVTFRKPGYEEIQMHYLAVSDTIFLDPRKFVDPIKEGSQTSNIPKRVIAGRVITSQQQGLKGVKVIVRSLKEDRFIAAGRTNSDGGYSLAFPKKEDISIYKLEFQLDGYKTKILFSDVAKKPIVLEPK